MDLGQRCMCIADLQKSWIVTRSEVAHIFPSRAMPITVMKLEAELHNHSLCHPAWEPKIRATCLRLLRS